MIIATTVFPTARLSSKRPVPGWMPFLPGTPEEARSSGKEWDSPASDPTVACGGEDRRGGAGPAAGSGAQSGEVGARPLGGGCGQAEGWSGPGAGQRRQEGRAWGRSSPPERAARCGLRGLGIGSCPAWARHRFPTASPPPPARPLPAGAARAEGCCRAAVAAPGAGSGCAEPPGPRREEGKGRAWGWPRGRPRCELFGSDGRSGAGGSRAGRQGASRDGGGPRGEEPRRGALVSLRAPSKSRRGGKAARTRFWDAYSPSCTSWALPVATGRRAPQGEGGGLDGAARTDLMQPRISCVKHGKWVRGNLRDRRSRMLRGEINSAEVIFPPVSSTEALLLY